MDFSFSEETLRIKETAERFAREIKEITPFYDKKGNPEECIPLEIYRKGAELGFTVLSVSEKYGGAGGSVLDGLISAEEIAWGDIGIAGGLLLSGEVAFLIEKWGKEGVKDELLKEVCEKKRFLALAATEPECGSDFFSENPEFGPKTKAVKRGNGYVITGRKQFITNAPIADIFVVFARTDFSQGLFGGVSAFVVTREMGLKTGKPEDKMGQRLLANAEVILDEVFVPEQFMLGEEGDGGIVVMDFLSRSNVGVGALSMGLARRAYDEAKNYAETRVQGGVPIKFHQAVGLKLFDMRAKIEAGRSFVYRASWEIEKYGKVEFAAFVKVFCSDIVNQIVTDAVQIFGGPGYMKDYPVEKLMRDAKVTQIYDGANDTIKARMIPLL